jgi:hypothetical protein
MWPGYSMRIAVEETLKGTLGQEVQVETGSGGGDCGTPLPVGDRFLIFAYRDEQGRLWTGLEGWSPLPKNDGPTYELVKSTLVGVTMQGITYGKGSLYGTVSYTAPPVWDDHGQPVGGGWRPVPDRIVRAVSDTGTFSTRTAKDGSYEFKDLPNGHYTVMPDVLEDWTFDHRWFPQAYERSVADGSCSKVNFDMYPATRLQGRVVPAPGQQFGVLIDGTIGLQRVVAIPVGLQNTNDRSGEGATVLPDGHFDIWPIPAGDYYVGINLTASPTPQEPYQPTYYPGVTEKKDARVVHLQSGETKYIEFPAPKMSTTRLVHIVAIGPDGNPLRSIQVQREDLQHPGDAFNTTVNVDLDANGAGSMNVYSGFTYHLHANARSATSVTTTWCAAPILIPAGSEPVDVRFVLNRSDTEADRAVTGIYDSPCTITGMDKAIKDAESRPQP